MSITYEGHLATFTDILTVDDAESLFEWMQTHPNGDLDLSGCTHLHAANLQVLMAARPRIVAWPTDEGLSSWLKNSLQERQ